MKLSSFHNQQNSKKNISDSKNEKRQQKAVARSRQNTQIYQILFASYYKIHNILYKLFNIAKDVKIIKISYLCITLMLIYILSCLILKFSNIIVIEGYDTSIKEDNALFDS
jgi:hypothetical protein